MAYLKLFSRCKVVFWEFNIEFHDQTTFGEWIPVVGHTFILHYAFTTWDKQTQIKQTEMKTSLHKMLLQVWNFTEATSYVALVLGLGAP